MDKITQANRLGTMEGYATTAGETVKLTEMPLPVHDPAFQDSAGPLSEGELDAFERTFNEAATDGPPIAGLGGDHWKDWIPDRPAVSDDLVYDWRIGVPALMQLIALRLEIIGAVDPSFNSDGFADSEVRAARNALASHYQKMLQGVRSNPYGGDFIRICADIYTGFYLTDLSPADPVPIRGFVQAAKLRKTRVLRQLEYDQMPLAQMRLLITNLDQLTSTLSPPWPLPAPAPPADQAHFQHPTVSMRPPVPPYEFRPDQVALLFDLGVSDPGRVDTASSILLTQNPDPRGPNFTTSSPWESGDGGFTVAASKMVLGDFNGDGMTDVASLYAINGDPHNVALLWMLFDGTNLVDDGSRLALDYAEFHSSTLLAADFDFDGTDDVAVFIPNTTIDGEHIQSVLIYHSTGSGFEFRQQINANIGSDAYRILSGDFNGDGYADIAIVSDQSAGISKITIVYLSAGYAYTLTDVWSGPLDLANMKLVSGDFDGDGVSDIGALYRYGDNTSQVFIRCGSEDLAHEHLAWISNPGGWTWESSKPFVGDFNADGYADLGIQYLSATLPNGSFSQSSPRTFTDSAPGGSAMRPSCSRAGPTCGTRPSPWDRSHRSNLSGLEWPCVVPYEPIHCVI